MSEAEDKINQGLKQKAHADNRKVERALMKFTGKTATQLRRDGTTALRDFTRRALQQQPVPQAAKEPVPMVKTTTTELPIVPTRKGGKGSNEGPPPPSPFTVLEDIVVVINGTPYYTNILTDGRLDEIT